MKIYRNEQHGFEIEIPEEWSLHTSGGAGHPSGKDKTLIFKCRSNEAFNIQVTPLTIHPFDYQIENEFRQFAQKKGGSSLELGRFNAEGEEHVWARFYIGGGLWTKKYRIILHGFEYMLTATCLEQKFLLDMEKVWDAVASSFCLMRDRIDTNYEAPAEQKKISVEPAAKNDGDTLQKDSFTEIKTYRNEELGIEIDVPAWWTVPANGPLVTQAGAELCFQCGMNEAFYITVKESRTKLSLEQIKIDLRKNALEKGYSQLEFGRVRLLDDEFLWVKYFMGTDIWVKKYLIFLNNVEYEITASRSEPGGKRIRFDQKCKEWDLVVKLLRVLHPPSENIFAGIWNKQINNQSATSPVTVNAPSENVTPNTMVGRKTYRNEKHGFEIDIPESWSPPPGLVYRIASAMYGRPSPTLKKDVFQYGCDEEAFNFEIAPLFPEPLLTDTEVEFQLFARDQGFKDLRLGRIVVAGKEHVCASYFIDDNMGKRWNKKYMIVFGGIEYAITGTSNDPQFFAGREKDWDSIIQTFRPLKPYDESANLTDRADRYRAKRREIVEQRIDMRDHLGDLYGRAYDAVALGNYKEARSLLEKCLQENPDHVLAHKELAVVLEKQGDIKGAIRHRTEVKRLAPNDLVNQEKLDRLLSGSGQQSDGLRTVKEMLKGMPGHPVYKDIEKKLTRQSPINNYKVTFYSSLICLLLTDISFFFPEYIAIRSVGCMSLLMLMPTWGVWVSGPWVGIPRKFSALLASALYLFFLIYAW